ncbi:MAG: hypothetical protein ACKO7G_03205, partial [Gammaproteobacteria bacterium]
DGSGGVERAAARATLERVVPDLERGFPADHPARRQAVAFLTHLRGVPATNEVINRWRDPRATIQF